MKALMMTFLIAIISLCTNASANLVVQYEKELQSKIGPLLRSYDPSASVYVDVEIIDQKVNMPLSPFTFNNLDMSKSGKMKVSSAEITIVSSLEAFPKAVMNVIGKIVSDYGVAPKYSFLRVEKKVVDVQKNTRTYLYLLIGVLLSCGVYFLINRQRNTLLASMNKQLSESISSIGEGFGGSGQIENKGSVQEIVLNSSAESHWDDMAIQSTHEIIMDCYWGREDHYASFIWSKLNISTKRELLSKSEYLADYVDYLEDQEKIDLKKENESYYMRPLGLAHLSNDILTNLVMSNPGLYQRLSTLRRDGLGITATQKMQLMSEDICDVNLEFPNNNSQARKLTKRILVYPSSIAEEEELLAFNDFTIEQKYSVVSLYWLSQLDEEDIKDILSPYTAKQIASVWLAPENVLETIAKCIPPKKLKLVNSYIESVEKSRRNDTFTNIYNDALEIVQQHKSLEAVS